MENSVKLFLSDALEVALDQPAAYAKALANFLFREVIEEAHVKYNISQEDIRDMCKKSVNRASLCLSMLEQKDPALETAFGIFALECREWDIPEITDDILEKQKVIMDCRDILAELTGNDD